LHHIHSGSIGRIRIIRFDGPEDFGDYSMFKHPAFGRVSTPEAIFSVFQPIIDLQTQKIMGYEALIRAVGKNNSPEQLFRTAYEQGYAILFDLKCLEKALEILPRLGKDQMLFVNIEPMTLGYAFREKKEADRILKKNRRFLRQIVFELTEGMMLRDFEFVKSGFSFLRRQKCQCAIDDIAGMGTKLLRLFSLKPEFVKIDISLINGISDNPLQQQIVRQLIDLSKKHGSKIIAEGIERKKDYEFIKKLKIDFGQGFLFAVPQKELVNKISIKADFSS